MTNEKIHYRLPLKLINSYNWAILNYPARAILPVLGVYYNRESGKAWPGREKMAKLSGYRKLRNVDKGINDLIKNNLVIKKREGRHNVYYLTSLALKEGRESFFPIYKVGMILSGKWAKLTKCEKSLYPVMGNKAKINYSEVLDSEFHAIGNIYEVKKCIKWSGISWRGFYRAYRGLNHKHLIEYWEDEDPYRYGIYVPQ